MTIDSESARIQAELKAQRAELARVNDDFDAFHIRYEMDRRAIIHDKEMLSNACNQLREEISELDVSKSQLGTDLKALEVQITERTDALAALNESLVSQRGVNRDLIADLARLSDDIRQAEERLTGVNSSQSEAKEKYEAKKAAYDKDIELLELKKADLGREMLQVSQQIEHERASIAIRQRELDDKDKNLRMREARITQKEEEVTRNYDLLNL